MNNEDQLELNDEENKIKQRRRFDFNGRRKNSYKDKYFYNKFEYPFKDESYCIFF